jgi:hypothetical protein
MGGLWVTNPVALVALVVVVFGVLLWAHRQVSGPWLEAEVAELERLRAADALAAAGRRAQAWVQLRRGGREQGWAPVALRPARRARARAKVDLDLRSGRQKAGRYQVARSTRRVSAWRWQPDQLGARAGGVGLKQLLGTRRHARVKHDHVRADGGGNSQAALKAVRGVDRGGMALAA